MQSNSFKYVENGSTPTFIDVNTMKAHTVSNINGKLLDRLLEAGKPYNIVHDIDENTGEMIVRSLDDPDKLILATLPEPRTLFLKYRGNHVINLGVDPYGHPVGPTMIEHLFVQSNKVRVSMVHQNRAGEFNYHHCYKVQFMTLGFKVQDEVLYL